MTCMVCRKSDVRLFNVGSNYGKINHTVGDDLTEIYGDEVCLFISPDSCVCNLCMNLLDSVTQLRRLIWTEISNPSGQPQTNKLRKFYKMFALKIEDDIEDVQLQDSNRTPTPKLLAHAYSVPYNENLEVQLAERERLRSLSRSSSYFTRSVSDTEVKNCENSEVQQIFTKRRKKAGHNWTKRKGQRKGAASKSGSLSSGYERKSRSGRRNTSPCSDSSYSSTYVRKYRSRRRRSPSFSSIRGERSSTRTRSVSRAQEEECLRKSSIFHCSVEECNVGCDDLEAMNQHNMDEHEMLPRHLCQECREVFTSVELLKVHMRCHDWSSFYCLMCGLEQDNSEELQQHLDEHMIYSVPCKYCDKSFLSKGSREKHVEKCRKTRYKRRIYKEKLILNRIDKSDDEGTGNRRSHREYEARYLYYSDMECEEGDLELTVENLLSCQIPIYTDEEGTIAEQMCTDSGYSTNVQTENKNGNSVSNDNENTAANDA